MSLDRYASLPNIITLGRLILVPVVISSMVNGDWPMAFAAFVIAGVSDAVDGWIAKTFDLRSELGAVLDPIADKALLISIFITLAVEGFIPATLAILTVSRDVMIVGGVIIAWLMDRPVEINPIFISKVNTAAQIAFAAAVLAAKAFNWPMTGWLTPAVLVVGALTLASAAAYLASWMRHLSQ
ncbi:MAG: CDP-alcohol phosphatidyltransferase family protein [Hyphomicrobiales bacterium]|nr:CDP-alcohol phosphatidyltransferase family protein [Hyphomicrobiales bacterium]